MKISSIVAWYGGKRKLAPKIVEMFGMKGKIMSESFLVNHGFWDLPPEERAAIKDAACERNDCVNFYDLPPEERDRAYEQARNDSR